jgi:ATP-binding cassette subfamily C (CFTR/MRP) protein 1
MSTTCEPMNDDLFGPIIQGCRSNFDFTLLFEQTILSIPPAAILLVLAPPRLVKLIRSRKKTLPNPIRSLKIVCTYMTLRIVLTLASLPRYY